MSYRKNNKIRSQRKRTLRHVNVTVTTVTAKLAVQAEPLPAGTSRVLFPIKTGQNYYVCFMLHTRARILSVYTNIDLFI